MAVSRLVKTLTLEAADIISVHAIKACVRQGFNPVTITVLDNAGDILVVKRMDGCPSKGFEKFSFAKALTCTALKMSSRVFRERYTSGDTAKFVQGLSMVTEAAGQLAPFPGGVLIRDGTDGTVLGAVGVSGAAGDEDEYIALQGVAGIASHEGFVTEPATHSCTTLKEGA